MVEVGCAACRRLREMNEDNQGKRLACAMESLHLQKKLVLVVGQSRAAVVVGDMRSLSLSVGRWQQWEWSGGGASEWKGE